MKGHNLFEHGVAGDDIPHLIRIQPLNSLGNVDLDVVPRLDIQWRGTLRGLNPPLKRILNLQGSLHVDIQGGNQIREAESREEGVLLVRILWIQQSEVVCLLDSCALSKRSFGHVASVLN